MLNMMLVFLHLYDYGRALITLVIATEIYMAFRSVTVTTEDLKWMFGDCKSSKKSLPYSYISRYKPIQPQKKHYVSLHLVAEVGLCGCCPRSEVGDFSVNSTRL